ncbi:hypothetical protein XBP1_270173 [Xenorhabdus bovienii str. puntauvense]|uniref:Uncharacterized protein n=1 Tax=Xenorhabdus bovienii str. puntauvense TaxID=1398201 RepID=A0A077NGT3_XENBV|nr:hypothetical protein XBP1_270173 [Xenorhabdus bovienii str. puntauvense]
MKTRQESSTSQKSSIHLSMTVPYEIVFWSKILILEQALSSIFYPELR